MKQEESKTETKAIFCTDCDVKNGKALTLTFIHLCPHLHWNAGYATNSNLFPSQHMEHFHVTQQ